MASASSSASVPVSAAQSAQGVGRPHQGSPAYYDSGLDTSPAPGQWSGWTSLGGTISDSPTLLETEGRVYLFARASDYTLWENNLTSGSWSGWFKRTEFTSDDYNGAFGAAAGDGGFAWITYRGIDGHVHLIEL